MLNKKDKFYLKKLIKKYPKIKDNTAKNYPLLENAFSNEDILKGIEVLLSQKITMSEITNQFEYEFAKFMGVKYALMVNSGSSANLLASFALTNPKKKNNLKIGDKFIIPAICWSTSLWPFVQCGLKPIFIDVNLNNFCLDEKKLNQKILDKAKAIVMIHVLGNSSNINEISKLAKRNGIYLIEDTCEALGSKYNSKYLGTFGDFGTYSFYYSHQITSGEGGMIVCNSKEDYELIYTLRSHGWDRGLYNKKSNKNFNFVNSGFNLRPLEVSAAIGLCQLRRLNKMIGIRNKNRNTIINRITNSSKWNDQYDFFYPSKNIDPSWFGLPILLKRSLVHKKEKLLNFLKKKGIETRPILSGNFLNQPGSKLYKFNNNKHFKNAQEIEERGFFIGLHTVQISEKKIVYLEKNLLNINKL